MSQFVQGLLFAVSAYIFWGIVPLYWKNIQEVSGLELLVHRVIWGGLILLLILFQQGKLERMKGIWKRKELWVSAPLILINWFIFIYAVNSGHILEASMGYFINPIFSILLGVFLLKEKLNRFQKFAIVWVFIGLLSLLVGGVEEIWISLVLMATFGFYGFLRKKAGVDSGVGLFFEVLFSLPFMLIILYFIQSHGGIVFFSLPLQKKFLVFLAGPVTIIPLVLYAEGLKRLTLSTVGVLQYITPTLQFLVGLFIYGEAFGRMQIVSYGFIWTGVLFYLWDKIRTLKKV